MYRITDALHEDKFKKMTFVFDNVNYTLREAIIYTILFSRYLSLLFMPLFVSIFLLLAHALRAFLKKMNCTWFEMQDEKKKISKALQMKPNVARQKQYSYFVVSLLLAEAESTVFSCNIHSMHTARPIFYYIFA